MLPVTVDTLGQIGVFFCGPTVLGENIRMVCTSPILAAFSHLRALQLTHAVLRLAKTSRLKMLKMGRRPSSRSIWKFFRCVVNFDFLFGNLLRHLMYGLKSRYIVDSLRHLASSLVPSLHSL